MKQKKQRRFSAGFTLIELLIVTVIIGILAVITVPSAIRMIERGQQTNRMNIARTIYLAAQNQLTKNHTERTLRPTLTEVYFDDPDLNVYNRVGDRLGAGLSLPLEEDRNFIRYIGKPAGFLDDTETEWRTREGAFIRNVLPGEVEFFALLDEVIIDNEILANAILMEFNIMTGVILSIFYGDEVGGQRWFDYTGSGNNEDISGTRGLNGYAHAVERRQGFFGVETTGEPDLWGIDENLRTHVIVNTYDGTDRPLVTNTGNIINVLYAEFLIPQDVEDEAVYSFILRGITDESIPRNLTIAEIQTMITFNGAVNFNIVDPSRPAIYWDSANPVDPNEVISLGVGLGALYDRYIWIIDYIVGMGDITVDERDIIINNPQFVRAEIISNVGARTTSMTRAHSHFGGAVGGRFDVSSARHLYNIRYAPDRNYRQSADIDMRLPNNEINDFIPISGREFDVITGTRFYNNAPFSGEYIAMNGTLSGFRIIGLNINNATLVGNVGLFREINGAIIQGLSLFDATIIAPQAANIGAFAGIMNGGRVLQSYAFANVVGQMCVCVDINGNPIPHDVDNPLCDSLGRDHNVGGLIGFLQNGILEESFNAGFTNALVNTESFAGIGSVRASFGRVGGLVGRNSGTITNCFNNARVNIEDVLVDDLFQSHTPTATTIIDRTHVGGIAGTNGQVVGNLGIINTGMITNSYATNYQPNYAFLFNSSSGGIVGVNTDGFDAPGNGNLVSNFYITNGLFDFFGAEAITKERLRDEFQGFSSRFQGGGAFVEGSNFYRDFYPYPVLRRNNPFPFEFIWNWEDIFEVPLGPIRLLYYERYDNGDYGYSEGGIAPLVNNNRERTVENEGYVLEFDDRRILNFVISTTGTGANSYILRPIPGGWEWDSLDADLVLPTHLPVWYDTDIHQELPRFRLFFENGFLENLANGAEFIFFEIRDALNEVLYRERFNPLFADTVGRQGALGNEPFSIRSPRHVRNINQALAFDFSQTINIDFDLYRAELDEMPVESDPVNTGIVINDGSQILFEDQAVVTGIFTGNYSAGVSRTQGVDLNGLPIFTWDNYELRNINAHFGLFDTIGVGARVDRVNIIDSLFTNTDTEGNVNNAINAVGSIAAINRGLIRMSSVQLSRVLGNGGGVRIGGIVGANERTTIDGNTFVGIIEDVFFLSTGADVRVPSVGTEPVNSAVSNNGGGIAGYNAVCTLNHDPLHAGNCDSGIIRRVLYLAPAPMAFFTNEPSGTGPPLRVYRKYPFVRDGAPVSEGCLFLRGHRYTRDAGVNWLNERYNFTSIYGNIRLSGGGDRMTTKFIDLEWLAFLNERGFVQGMGRTAMGNWHQPPKRLDAVVYPYPIINGMVAPTIWPEADSPVRPDQQTEPTWASVIPVAGRIPAPEFVNGDFASAFHAPGVPGGRGADNVNVAAYQHMGYWWFTADMRIIDGWYTRPVPEFRNLYNPSDEDYFLPARFHGRYSGLGDFRMISPTAGSISATSTAAGTSAANLFSYVNYNDNTASDWRATSVPSLLNPQTISWSYSQPMTVHHYELFVASPATSNPRRWVLEGRNGSSDWVPIHTSATYTGNFPAAPAGQFPRRTYQISGDANPTPVAYQHYRLRILGTGGVTVAPELRQIRMYLSDVVRWRLIETQVANGELDASMRTDYRGRNLSRTAIANNQISPINDPVNARSNAQESRIRYAELNAESQGTLFQVLPTTPGAMFYYSFYHSTNGFPNLHWISGDSNAPGYTGWYVAPDSGGDRLHFYLSGVDLVSSGTAIEVTNADYSAIRDAAMVLIRPCQSPRSRQLEYSGIIGTALATNFDFNRVNMGITAGHDRIVLNPAAWNTVNYGRSDQPELTATTGTEGLRSGGPYDLSYHRGRAYLQPNGNRVVQNIPTTPIYLYDVWVDTRTGITIANNEMTSFTQNNNAVSGNISDNPNVTRSNGGTRTGYGITFWSTRNLTTNNSPSNGTITPGTDPHRIQGNIHINGITQAQLNTTGAGSWGWLNDARNNVIGYWDVDYGWKRFYGEYTVPAEQVQTEFAFQSRSGLRRVVSGNYLDGVSFQSPAFLTIDKYVRNNVPPTGNPNAFGTPGENVTFVKPNDRLFIELFVKNHGEVVSNNIVIKDRLVPYTEYIDYGGNVEIHRRAATPKDQPSPPWVAVTVPASNIVFDGDELRVTLPANEGIGYHEEIRVRFRITVRDRVQPNYTLDNPYDVASTLLYHFKNQGVVEYREDFLRYGFIPFANASGPEPVQVFIDPVKLSKSVDPLRNGPFTVTLRVEDTTIGDSSVNTDGIITDLIPHGFELLPGITGRTSNGSVWTSLPSVSSSIYHNNDGTTRMTIGGVSLGGAVKIIEYQYQIRYMGADYGIAELQILSDYKYLYQDEHIIEEGEEPFIDVMLMFPKVVVGLSPVTTNDIFAVISADNSFDILANDNFARLLEQDGYAVEQSVIFVDSNGVPLRNFLPAPPEIPNFMLDGGNARYETAAFIAGIARAANIRDWRLTFSPKAGSAGSHMIYYQIMLTARKGGSPDIVIYSRTASVTITVPSVTVTALNLRNIDLNATLPSDARIIYTLINDTFASTINPADFVITGLPPGLTAQTAVRTSDRVITIPITGAPTELSADAIELVLPSMIPASNMAGGSGNIVLPENIKITVGPVIPAAP